MSTESVELQNYLDVELGSDIKQLKNIEELYNATIKRKENLQEQLSIIQTEVPSKIKDALASANEYLDKVEEFHLAKSSVNSELTECVKNGAPAIERFQHSIRKVDEINKCISYLKWIAKIEDTSGGVQRSILSDSMEDACTTFQELLQLHSTLIGNSTQCSSLVSFLKDTIQFWYSILKDKLAKELEVVLKQIGWPFISGPGPHTLQKVVTSPDKSGASSFSQQDPALHLESVIANLLLIHLPPDFESNASAEKIDSVDSSKVAGNATEKEAIFERNTVLLPFKLLLQPLRKRFRFHFIGNKPTNDIKKPEWYLTQVINWISHHAGFLEHTIQPILDNNNHSHVDALLMFAQGLLRFVTEKLSSDVEEILYDDDLFSHTVDEVLLFDRELRDSYDISDYLLKTHGPVTVLARSDCIQKWLNVERTCAGERLDALLSSEHAWQSQLSHADADESDDMRTPECAEAFVTMLLTITDRYKYLPSYHDQLQFLDLQLLLLDDFRIRLTQVMRSLTSSLYDDVSLAILNASLYMTTVLREWADNVFFLQLKYYKDKESNNPTSNPLLPNSLLQLGESKGSSMDISTDETVFDSVVSLYDRIYLEGLDSIAQAIMAEYRAKSQAYLHDQWIALPLPEEQVVFVVSQSACPMLEVLQEQLYSFEQKLGRTLFTKLWRCIAENVDQHMLEEVVMKNYFNAGGAAQLQFDMTRNLFPLFGPYTNKPENYFKRMKESCQLLNLQIGNAMLLKEAISDSDKADDAYDRVVPKPNPAKILAEMGVTLLKSEDVANILKRRIDWTTA